MKTLYLVRHAKSSWKFPNLPDHDRPLNKRGERNAPEMGKRLSKRGILPDIIISSTALRACTTAQHIASKIGYPYNYILEEIDLFHASEKKILDIVRKVDNKFSSLMIFGHNPGFTWFANNLGDFYTNNIPTCGVVAFEFDIDSWQELQYNTGSLLFYDYPKKLDNFKEGKSLI